MPITMRGSDTDTEKTIFVSGRFDFSTHQDFVKCYKPDDKGSKHYVVDFRQAEYMDSSALGMLLQLREYSGSKGVALVNGNDSIKEVLRIANFDKLFKVA